MLPWNTVYRLIIVVIQYMQSDDESFRNVYVKMAIQKCLKMHNCTNTSPKSPLPIKRAKLTH